MKVFCIGLVVLVALALGDAKNIPTFKSSRLIRSLITPFAVTTTKRSAGLRSLAPFSSLLPKLSERQLSESEEAVAGLAALDAAFEDVKRHVARKANKRQADSEEAEALLGLAALEDAFEEKKRHVARKVNKRQFSSEEDDFLSGLEARKANKRQSASDEEDLAELAVLDALTDKKKRRAIVNSVINKRKAKPTSEEDAEALLGLAVLDELDEDKKRNAEHKALKVTRKALKSWFPHM